MQYLAKKYLSWTGGTFFHEFSKIKIQLICKSRIYKYHISYIIYRVDKWVMIDNYVWSAKQQLLLLKAVGGVIHTIGVPWMHYYAKKLQCPTACNFQKNYQKSKSK